MRNKEIIAIADDTTGALDVAGSFFSRGYSSSVFLNTSSLASDSSSIVFDLNNRYDDEITHAKSFQRELQSIVKEYNAGNIFLKVDSTLRGHIQSDVMSLRNKFGDRPIFIAPAFPHSGRLCQNGKYTVDGKLITESIFAKDHSFKMQSSDMQKNFPMGIHVNGKIIEAGPQAIVDTVFKSGKSVITFDTNSQSDLESIALAARFVHAVCVGSSGLARAFPSQQGGIFHDKDRTFNETIPTLFVVGSAHPKSRNQLNALQDLDLPEITLEAKYLNNEKKLLEISDQVQQQLYCGKTTVLSSPDTYVDDRGFMNDIENAVQIITGFHKPLHNLVLVGGETARGVLVARMLYAFQICGEYEPGIPISRSDNDCLWHILTKAGGFGSQYVLNLIYKSIYRESNHD